MSEDAQPIDPLSAKMNEVWERVCRGTYAESDKRLFETAFRAGYTARRHGPTLDEWLNRDWATIAGGEPAGMTIGNVLTFSPAAINALESLWRERPPQPCNPKTCDVCHSAIGAGGFFFPMDTELCSTNCVEAFIRAMQVRR